MMRMGYRFIVSINQTSKAALQIALFALVIIVMIGGIALFAHSTLIRQRGNLFDFYPRYIGGQAVWQGISPYADRVTDQIQRGMFGDTLPEQGFDQQRFAYPAYAAWILAPLLLLPAEPATAIWMGIQFTSVLVSILLWFVILRWKPRPLWLGVIVFGLAFVFRYPVNMFVVGQFTGLNLLLITTAVLLLTSQSRFRAAAGLLFALATLPPTFTVPLIMLMGGGMVRLRRWTPLLAFAALLVILTALTTLQIGWWIPAFIEGLRAYADYSFPVWAPGLLPPIFAFVLVVFVCGAWVWAFWRLDDTRQRLIDLIGLSVIVVLLLVPQTGSYTLTFLIMPLSMTIECTRHLSAARRWITLSLIGAAIISPWVLLNTPRGLEMLVVPVLVLGAYLFVIFGEA
jgi:hypothetical protein